MTRRILVTSALPYANGPIHIGHLLEYVMADVWVRFMRMSGHQIHFVCADDAHGTPIMLEAEKQGVAPEALVEQMRKEHLEDFTDFGISFDNYHSTHSDENQKLSQQFYAALHKKGLISTRMVEQLYDPERKQFLADRYIRGICPRCKAEDQTGDNCESCSATYAATDLGEPRSVLSGAALELRESLHYFFDLPARTEFLQKWLSEAKPGPGYGARLQPQAEKKLSEWFAGGLQDWDISRDAPYFGFLIPDTKDKYFYVWLDAPIGYLASFANLCVRDNLDFEEFMRPDNDTELYHFIGKDIMNFHGLFWPAMLDAVGYRTPTRLFIHGFLTVNGAKMSKSKGTFITARSYVQLGLNPDWLRYYFISKLNDRIEDVDLHMEDFVNRVNADLVNKLANIPSRVAKILQKEFDNKLAADAPQWIAADLPELAKLYERRRFSDAMRNVMALAEQVNRELESAKPWLLARDPERHDELHRVCTSAIQAFRVLCGLLKPVVPTFAQASETYLQVASLSWQDLSVPLPAGHELGRFSHLMRRIEPKQLIQLQEMNKAAAPTPDAPALIDIEDFAKVELRVAQITAASEVAESDKLVKLEVSLGADGTRQILAGIRQHVVAAELVGRKIVICANLAPRKMRFGTSEGMALAASDADGGLFLLGVSEKCPAGAKIS